MLITFMEGAYRITPITQFNFNIRQRHFIRKLTVMMAFIIILYSIDLEIF